MTGRKKGRSGGDDWVFKHNNTIEWKNRHKKQKKRNKSKLIQKNKNKKKIVMKKEISNNTKMRIYTMV